MANAEYTKDQQGNSQVFRVTPAPRLSYRSATIFSAVIFIVGLLATVTGAVGFGLFFMAIGGLGLWAGLTWDYRPKAHRAPRIFQISPNGIEADGLTFKRDDIHRLIIKNGMSQDRVLSSWSPTQAALAAPHMTTLSSGAVAENIKQRAKTALICYSLDVETGGKAYMLAGGMDETTAYGLMRDVSKVLGFSEGKGV